MLNVCSIIALSFNSFSASEQEITQHPAESDDGKGIINGERKGTTPEFKK